MFRQGVLHRSRPDVKVGNLSVPRAFRAGIGGFGEKETLILYNNGVKNGKFV